ncbi:MAG TPA: DUF2628 domain-containing protein [Hyphomicrobiaceae bacterium]|nr:DUF2628 domain-containing protein [Hyphomicrobiaceae bacterium]
MTAYTVYEPPDPPADRLDRAESLEFVKEGFSWAAALLAPFWLAANRMWLVLAGYLGGMMVLQLAFAAGGAGQRMTSLILLAVHVLIGFEADSLKRWTLERNGWRMVGSAVGRNWAECERRFFEAWLPGEPYIKAEALSAQGGSLPLSGSSAAKPTRWRGLPFAPRA